MAKGGFESGLEAKCLSAVSINIERCKTHLATHTASFNAQDSLLLIMLQHLINEGKCGETGPNHNVVKLAMGTHIFPGIITRAALVSADRAHGQRVMIT